VYEEQAKLGVIEREGAAGVRRVVGQLVREDAPSLPPLDPQLHRSQFHGQPPAPECE